MGSPQQSLPNSADLNCIAEVPRQLLHPVLLAVTHERGAPAPHDHKGDAQPLVQPVQRDARDGHGEPLEHGGGTKVSCSIFVPIRKRCARGEISHHELSSVSSNKTLFGAICIQRMFEVSDILYGLVFIWKCQRLPRFSRSRTRSFSARIVSPSSTTRATGSCICPPGSRL